MTMLVRSHDSTLVKPKSASAIHSPLPLCIHQPIHLSDERVRSVWFGGKLCFNATRRGVTLRPESEESGLRSYATLVAGALANMKIKMLSLDEVHRICYDCDKIASKCAAIAVSPTNAACESNHRKCFVFARSTSQTPH